MINNRLQTILGVLVVCGAMAAPANTAEVASGTPDPATSREFSAKLMMCGQCHGGNGTPVRPGIPVIWGQEENYLLKQLRDFRTKSRDAELMTWAAITLHQEEMGPTASFFAKKSWPQRTAATPAAAPARPNGLAVCQACHQANFQGAPLAEGTAAPRLAGQSYEYLVQTMSAYADGKRKNNEVMMGIMAAMSAADRDAMARYLSSL